MTDRPRVAVITYGSLLHPEDLTDLFGRIRNRTQPVKVDGFRRAFNQEASWRETEGDDVAVMNVGRSEGSWFNGLMVADLDRSEFAEFRERERGYWLVEVEPESLDEYSPTMLDTSHLGDSPPDLDDQDLVLVPTGKKVRMDVSPIDDYVNICLTGAREWGSDFYEDFLTTTELASGRSLESYMDERA